MSSDFLTELSRIVLELQRTKGAVYYADLISEVAEKYPDKERTELHALIKEHADDLVGVIEAHRLIK